MPPDQRTPLAISLKNTVAAGDGEDASAAATEDDDEGGDETPAASTAGVIQDPRSPQIISERNKEPPRAITSSVIAVVDTKKDSPAARTPRGEAGRSSLGHMYCENTTRRGIYARAIRISGQDRAKGGDRPPRPRESRGGQRERPHSAKSRGAYSKCAPPRKIGTPVLTLLSLSTKSMPASRGVLRVVAPRMARCSRA